jgi:hypothetical protein
VGIVTEDSVRSRYEARWEEAEAIDLDTCGREELAATAEANLGQAAAATIVTETDRDTRGMIDPVSLVVWAGAAAEARTSEVLDIVESTGIASGRTANRRIEFFDEELIDTVPVPDGTKGHPDRRLS